MVQRVGFIGLGDQGAPMAEMIVRAARGGYRVLEVPVDYRARAGGRSKVSGSLRASLRAGWHMLRVAWVTPATDEPRPHASERTEQEVI